MVECSHAPRQRSTGCSARRRRGPSKKIPVPPPHRHGESNPDPWRQSRQGCPASGRKRIIAMRERNKSKAMRARKPGSEVERPARAQGGWGDKRTAECMYVRRGFLRDSRSSQGLEVPKFHLAHPTPFGQVLRYEKTQGWCPAARGASAFVSRYRMGII